MSVDTIPTTQSAWLVTRRGKPNKSLLLKKDAPVPSDLSEGEVLVYAAALNPVGYKMMQYFPNFVAQRPHVAEHDISGVVVDPNGSGFHKGDEVFGWLPVPVTIKTSQGALAQYTRIRADHLVKKPAVVNFIEAAGISLAAMTAHQALELAALEPGQTILINGGTTSVGSFAIQMAKAKGCKVFSSCSTTGMEIVKRLGADEIIDYKVTPVAQHLRQHPPSPKFHIILGPHAVASSAELFTSSPAYLATNGIFISVGISSGGVSGAVMGYLKTMVWPVWLGGTRRTHKIVRVSNKHVDLATICGLVEEGMVRPLVDSVYTFDDVYKAYDRIMTGRAKGKVVVAVVAV